MKGGEIENAYPCSTLDMSLLEPGDENLGAAPFSRRAVIGTKAPGYSGVGGGSSQVSKIRPSIAQPRTQSLHFPDMESVTAYKYPFVGNGRIWRPASPFLRRFGGQY